MKSTDIRFEYLSLVARGENVDSCAELHLAESGVVLVDQESALKRRGRFYDYVVASLIDYAKTEEPRLTVEEASQLLIEFPIFLSELQVNWNGKAYLRELPNLPRTQTRCGD